MTANLLLILRQRWHYATFLRPPALATSEHHRGNAVLFALALMPMCLAAGSSGVWTLRIFAFRYCARSTLPFPVALNFCCSAQIGLPFCLSLEISRGTSDSPSRFRIGTLRDPHFLDASADRQFRSGHGMLNRAQSVVAMRRWLPSAVVTLVAMSALAALTADAAARRTTEATAPRKAGEPIMAIVSIKSQHVTFYDADGWILSAPVS